MASSVISSTTILENPLMSHQRNMDPPPETGTDYPFTDPSEWYLYRCRSCDYTEWVEDIVFDAFPPAAPGDGPVLVCRECEKNMRWDRTTPTRYSFDDPTFADAASEPPAQSH